MIELLYLRPPIDPPVFYLAKPVKESDLPKGL